MRTVIIHGWSDEATSFERLREFVNRIGNGPVSEIRLVDWISMHDEVTYDDVTTAMQRAWKSVLGDTAPRSVDVVVHSTGALVTRDWMTRFHSPDSCPIHRFVMLAPANFGSPLAHKGRSFIGRAVKGWGNPDFQTGRAILKGLELGSPYTFRLAQRDLFHDLNVWYGPGRILATVIVGNKGYSGVEAIANEYGSDGTVRISTANLNAALLQLELDERQNLQSATLQSSRGPIGFALAQGENHSTVALKGRTRAGTEALIAAALKVGDAQYEAGFPWQRQLDAMCAGTRAPRMQNTVTWLHDDQGHDVSDYFVEFYRKANSDRRFEQSLYEDVIRSVHAYGDNPAYRSIYLDVDRLDQLIHRFKSTQQLYVSVSARPVFHEHDRQSPVGYRNVDAGTTCGLPIPVAELGRYFEAHRSLLVSIRLGRGISDRVFAFS